MSVSNWVTWALSCIVTGVNWLTSIQILGVPVLYLLLGIIIMGVVIRAIPFRA